MTPDDSSRGAFVPAEAAQSHVERDLETLRRARRYQAWQYELIRGALGRRILEVGSGLGTYTQLLARHGHVLATEVEPRYVAALRTRFRDEPRVSAESLSLASFGPEALARVRAFAPDTVVCLNVLEHVPDDSRAFDRMLQCLEPGGFVVLIVPALPRLFSEIDRRYGHRRRYTRRALVGLVRGRRSAELVRCRYFNAAGVLGWWLNHVVLKRTALPLRQVRVFDSVVVPAALRAERLLPPPLGLSLLAWVRKAP